MSDYPEFHLSMRCYWCSLIFGDLSRLFDDTSNCYKFFWFQAILRKLTPEHTRFSFDELINEMIADAWYMVTEYHLHLGPCGVIDNLEEAVKYIGTVKQFPAAEKREVIISQYGIIRSVRLGKFAKLFSKIHYRKGTYGIWKDRDHGNYIYISINADDMRK